MKHKFIVTYNVYDYNVHVYTYDSLPYVPKVGEQFALNADDFAAGLVELRSCFVEVDLLRNRTHITLSAEYV